MSDMKIEETAPVATPAIAEDTKVTDAPSVKVESEEKPEVKPAAIKDEPVNQENDQRQSPKKNGFRNNNNGVRYNKRENKSKYDASVLEKTDDRQRIQTQVKFYFDDSNLPQDEHMWKLTGGPENNPVPIRDIATFGRMRRFQPYEAVVEALKGLPDFFVVEGEAGQETIKRKTPYDPNQPAAVREARSIYAKGFGEEEPTTQFDVEAFFAAYGPTNAVRLRRTDDKLFKGSCFVEFADEETAKKFLALDPKPLWKGEHVLEIKSKKEYVDEKAQLIREGKMEPNAPHKKPFRGGRQQRGNFRGGNRDRNDRDSNDWKKRRENDQKNGFRDNRGGRGGRGRGRGGNDRGPRPDRHEDKNKARVDPTYADSSARPDKAEATENGESKKRAREDDGEGAPAKKVDAKESVPAESASA